MQETPPIPGVSLRRRLAVGGMGELFLADEALADGSTRACVLKRLLPGAGADEARLFAREALALTALARLDSPHIVRLYRSGPGWLLLEWVDGVDLAALIEHRRRRGRALPLGVAMAIAQALVRGLAALAQARDADGAPLGLVHRDVHPGNVLLGRDGAVRLADLGVVALGAQPTQAGLKGTLAWMAPEQLRAGQTSSASDVYSAGLIAYELFTGQPSRPLGNAGLSELLAARSTVPAAAADIRPELDAALAEAIMAPLAVDPAARPSVQAWGELLARSAVEPDPSGLAKLVSAMDSAPVASAAPRTFVQGAVAGAAGPARVRSSARRWWIAVLAFVALAALALTWMLVGGDGPRAPLEAEPDVRAPLVELDAAIAVALVEDVGDGDDSATAAEGDTANGGDVAGDVRGDEADALGPSEPESASDAVSDAAVAVDSSAPRDALVALDAARRVDARAAAPTTHRLRVTARDGPVHVSGGGLRGLAPVLSGGLASGEGIAFNLTGGAQPMGALVRVRLRGDALIASIGAPSGTLHKVICAGQAARETPVFGLAVPAAGVACRLEASDGRTMSFVLSHVIE